LLYMRDDYFCPYNCHLELLLIQT